MKSKVYRTKVDTRDELLDLTMDVIASIKEHQDALRRATHHALTQVAKCSDAARGILKKCIVLGKLYQLCHLNNIYQHQKQYVVSLYQQFCNCTVKQLYLRNHLEYDTYIYTCLLRMTDSMTSQNVDISSWNSLYIFDFMYTQFQLHKILRALYFL